MMTYDRRTAKIARYYERVADGALGEPVSLQVALTDSCFNRCAGCGHPSRPQRKMIASHWLQFLEARSKLESVCYSGGDPMAFRDFNAVMAYHIARDLSFGMTITGYIPPFINLPLMAHAAWVRVSLDAVTPEVYAKVRGHTPVEKVLNGIEEMQKYGVNICLGVTISPDNEAEFENVQAYAASHGIVDVEARYAYPASNPRWPNVSLADRGVQPFEHCYASLYQLYIDSDGSVFPCCITAGDTRSTTQALALGNIFHNPWEEIWAAVVEYSRVHISKLPPICRACCVERLSEINAVCGALPKGKSFF